MAFLVKYKRSPYWSLRSRKPDGGWTTKSTGYRVCDDLETRKAKAMASKAGVEEFAENGTTRNNPAFRAWVPLYIEEHYEQKSQATKRRMDAAWKSLTRFLNTVDVQHPRQVKFHHGQDFIRWRVKTKTHGRNTSHNTALMEIKFLSQLMNEAIRRELADSNPLMRLGIPKAAVKVKPELTDDDIAKLRAHFASLVENHAQARERRGGMWGNPRTAGNWMGRAFEIALYTGCRFNECEVAREAIDLKNGTLRITDSKRKIDDPRKFFTVPIHERLRPTLAAFLESGEAVTCHLTRDRNSHINTEFKAAGVNATFHSLRVTFVTRCHRSGLTAIEAMRLVNHSSQLIHKVYSRLNVDDVRVAQSKLQLP